MAQTQAKAKAKTASPPKADPKRAIGKDYPSAIDKIRDEMALNDERYVQIVGEYLTEYVQSHPEAGEKILDKDKDIKGSLNSVRAEAEKHKEGNVGVVDDATAFGIVLRYFGIEETGNTGEATSSGPSGHIPMKGKAKEADPFDLDALIGAM